MDGRSKEQTADPWHRNLKLGNISLESIGQLVKPLKNNWIYSRVILRERAPKLVLVDDRRIYVAM